MNIQEFVKLMNEDLLREYEHWFTYMQAASSVRGLNRLELEEFFLEEAKDEMEHIHEFALRLNGLDTEPVTSVALSIQTPIDDEKFNRGDSRFWLEKILAMEIEVVEHFAKRIKTTEEIGGADGYSLHVFYEDMINDSRKTVDKVKMILNYYPFSNKKMYD